MMTAPALPEGAPLCARMLYALLTALPTELHDKSPTSREVRAAAAEIAERSPLVVRLSRSEMRQGYAYLHKLGIL